MKSVFWFAIAAALLLAQAQRSEGLTPLVDMSQAPSQTQSR